MNSTKTMTEQERTIYKAGYIQGQNDALVMLSAVLAGQRDSAPGEDLDVLGIAEKALRATGSPMTIAHAAH